MRSAGRGPQDRDTLWVESRDVPCPHNSSVDRAGRRLQWLRVWRSPGWNVRPIVAIWLGKKPIHTIAILTAATPSKLRLIGGRQTRLFHVFVNREGLAGAAAYRARRLSRSRRKKLDEFKGWLDSLARIPPHVCRCSQPRFGEVEEPELTLKTNRRSKKSGSRTWPARGRPPPCIQLGTPTEACAANLPERGRAPDLQNESATPGALFVERSTRGHRRPDTGMIPSASIRRPD